jgi:uncharacterized protein
MKAKLQADMIAAMKAGEKKTLSTLRGLIAEVKKTEIDTQKELDDSGVAGIIQKEVKKRRDTIQFAKDAGRHETVAECEEEIKTLQKYLGEQLSEEKLKELIQSLIAGGADNIGKVMGALNKDHKGLFDGKQASEMIKTLLG